MKKMTTLFFLCILFFLCNKTETLKPATKTIEKQDVPSFCYVDLKENITTYHFLEYFKQIEVVSISPRINPLYEKKIPENLQNYLFTAASHQENIETFQKWYQNTLYNLGLSKESNTVYMYGVPLAQTKIICTEETIQKIKKISQNIIIREN